MNSKKKGSAGEREACKAVSEHLRIEARRSQQYCGRSGDADLQTTLHGVHFEVKRTECLRLYDAVEQAKNDCRGKVPVVLHRRNRGEWLVIVPLNRLKDLAMQLECGE